MANKEARLALPAFVATLPCGGYVAGPMGVVSGSAFTFGGVARLWWCGAVWYGRGYSAFPLQYGMVWLAQHA